MSDYSELKMGKLSAEDEAIINDLLADIPLDDDERATIAGMESIEIEEIIADTDASANPPTLDDVMGDIHEATVLDDAAHDALSSDLVRREAYESQVSETEMTLEEVEPAKGKAKAAKVAKVAKTPKKGKTEKSAAEPKSAPERKEEVATSSKPDVKPHAPRSLAELEPACFVLSTDVPDDLEANKRAVIAKRPAQVKIAEKFDNALIAAAANKKPSVYVMHCYGVLRAKGTVTQADLYGAMTAGHGLGEGTARSQAGQIMVLFDLLGIADRAGQTLTKRADSTLALAYDEFLDA